MLEHVSGVDINTYTRAKVWDPIGAQDSSWRQRAGGLTTGWVASTRDMARLGLLVRNQGAWDGAEVLRDRSYLAAALSPSQPLNHSYGYLWWLNGQDSFVLPGRARSGTGPLIPPAPADVVAALGAADKKIYVCPSRDLVIARHGGAAGGTQTQALSSFDAQLWQKIMAVLS